MLGWRRHVAPFVRMLRRRPVNLVVLEHWTPLSTCRTGRKLIVRQHTPSIVQLYRPIQVLPNLNTLPRQRQRLVL